ncbi:MAG: hypothetical protein IKL07_07025 [Clostridium sp.]|nr:hypothetical protein [Clostridium sp.]
MIMRKEEYPKRKLEYSLLHKVILRADGWTSECPYRQTVTVDGITYSDTVDLLMDEQMEREEAVILQRALIVSEMQGINSVTVKAYGKKPSTDLNLLVAVGTIEESYKAGA